MNDINETEEGIRAIISNSDTKMSNIGLKLKRSEDTELKTSNIGLKIKTSEDPELSMLCEYINMHPQPFKVKVDNLSLAFALQIKSLIMPNARGERLKQAQGIRSISAFAAEDDFLNPVIIDAQAHQGNKNYLSLETAHIMKRSITGIKQEINNDWVMDRFKTLKRKFKVSREIRIKLERMMVQKRTEASAITDSNE